MRRIAALAAAFSLFHAACDGDTAATKTPDTVTPAEDVATPGGDVEAPGCAVECFFNVECADNERCAETEGQAYGCCEVGARGTSDTAASCASGAECASGVCIEVTTDSSVCSVPCTGDGTCPAALPKCNTFFGACIPAE